VIVDRLRCALALAPCRVVVIAGGVAANQTIATRLRTFARDTGLMLCVPPQALCTDNGAMIAWAGVERLRLGLSDPLDFVPKARWPLAEVSA
jgi:N6-L-threonylcarbamoyladenine synthase